MFHTDESFSTTLIDAPEREEKRSRYQVLSRLGEGGSGEVFVAYDRHLEREVALKRPLPEVVDMGGSLLERSGQKMLAEARAVGSVNHPNVVNIFEAGFENHVPFITMELVRGETLGNIVRDGVLVEESFRELAFQCMGALSTAHRAGLVHRDLSPANIMITRSRGGRFEVKILDFGLAEGASPRSCVKTLTRKSSATGSVYCMAPELLDTTGVADARTDIYALGCLFYFALAGNYPFRGDTPEEVVQSHLKHTMRPLESYRTDLPAWISKWIAWMINRSPSDRPRSMAEAMEVLIENGG